MQTLQPGANVPAHPNIVELAALLENDRLKSAQREVLQRALRDALRNGAHAQRLFSKGRPMLVAP